MKLQLLCIGRLSLTYLREGAADFEQRLKRYLPLSIEELKEESSGRKADPERTRVREGEQLLARVPEGAYVVALDENGKLFSSEELARQIERHMLEGTAGLTWIIGGAYGLSDAVRKRADLVLSLSRMTLTHQMARLVLLEQLYRGMTIIRREPYHNR